MIKIKPTKTKSVKELANFLGLSNEDAAEIEFRVQLNEKIIAVVLEQKLTHAQVAKMAGTSRTRITAIINRNIKDVSSDLMLRILASQGYKAKVKFMKAS